jgi:UDP-GlcNAc:undecaprenyl-phosphate/decaprenyl-phosphate GlcNAc-1-phosphate transferase
VEVSWLGGVRIPYSLILFLAAAALTLGMTPGARWLALRLGTLDHPGPRRVHLEPVPKLGGLAMAIAILAVAWGAYLLPGPVHVIDPRPLMGFTIAGLVILALGIADDVRGASPVVKIVVQSAAAVILTRFGLGISMVSLPFGHDIPSGIMNVPLTIAWVLLVTNAINLIDGLDGLAAGTVFIASMTLWWVGRGHQDIYVMFMTAILAGSTLGFLRYNFPPARVFMGDTGSQFLGFALATISLIDNRKGTATITLLFPLVTMGVPILDGILAFGRRALDGRSVFVADAGHLHHRLLRIGLSKRSAVLVLWYVCAYLGVMAVVLSALPRHYAWFVLVLLAMGIYLAIQVLEFVDRQIQKYGPPSAGR